MTTDLASLTEDERRTVTEAAAILAAHADPRTPEQIRAEAERAEYEQRIAESAARAARDPNAQALAAAGRKRVEEQRRRDLEEAKAAAKSDSRADAERTMRLNPGIGPHRRCIECHVGTFTFRQPAPGITLCQQCWGQHRLSCDECGRHGDLTSYCPPDNSWRCDECVPKYLAGPIEYKPGPVMIPSLAGPR